MEGFLLQVTTNQAQIQKAIATQPARDILD